MRFEEHEDHYLDTMTGIKWSKENSFSSTWQDAVDKAPSGWGLPTIEDLMSIVDYEKYNPATELPGMLVSSYYWSSTTCAHGSVYAWNVHFFCGVGYYKFKSSVYYVRYVKED